MAYEGAVPGWISQFSMSVRTLPSAVPFKLLLVFESHAMSAPA